MEASDIIVVMDRYFKPHLDDIRRELREASKVTQGAIDAMREAQHKNRVLQAFIDAWVIREGEKLQ
jgi:hypothetical protein